MRKQFIVAKGQELNNQFMARGLGNWKGVKDYARLLSIKIKKFINFTIRIEEK